MPAFQPTADQFRSFRDDPYDGPISQLNILKFHPRAQYAVGDAEHGSDESGAAAYQRYVDAFVPAAAEVGGSLAMLGEVERYFIGNGDWDAVMLMQFPNRAAFIATVNHETYPEMHRHRTAGLLCQELLTLRPAAALGETD